MKYGRKMKASVIFRDKEKENVHKTIKSIMKYDKVRRMKQRFGFG